MSANPVVEPVNRLLAALPQKLRGRLLAECTMETLHFNTELYGVGQRIRHVYFPVAGFISLLTVADGGDYLEVGIAGNEGMLGASLVLGLDIAPQRALVQGAGRALCLKASTFRSLLARYPVLRQHLLRYVYVQVVQLAQLVACHRYHTIGARLARWLLMSGDRAHASRFRVTHEFLALMLGVRRAGVSQAACRLQNMGLIHYRRGDVTILHRADLKRAACPCYRRDLELYRTIMSRALPTTGQGA